MRMNAGTNGAQTRKQTNKRESPALPSLGHTRVRMTHLLGVSLHLPVTAGHQACCLRAKQATRSGSEPCSCCVPTWDMSPPFSPPPSSPLLFCLGAQLQPLPSCPPAPAPNPAPFLLPDLSWDDTHSHLSLLIGLSIC